MAFDMFFKIIGANGESRDKYHKGEIDVLAWSWGQSQSGSFHNGGGGTGKVNVQDLSITKYVDSSSPALMLHCATGEHISDAHLYVRTSGKNPLEYIHIHLQKVMVTSVSTGGSSGSLDRLTENITLNFARIKYEYIPVSDKGMVLPALTYTWNVEANSSKSLPASPNDPNNIVTNLNATSGNDVLIGDETNNVISGLSGSDTLKGLDGNDTLNGDTGRDILIGGAGADSLYGGAGADIFRFENVSDSTKDATDIIFDFSHKSGDKIDLSSIDANESLDGKQSFKFIGIDTFSTTDATGQLRFDAATQTIYGSTNADNNAEFVIQLNGTTGISASDFIL